MTPNVDRIKQARKARKLSQNAVADEIGMPRSSYAVSEKTGNFSIDELKKIYKFLDISGEEETKKPGVDDYQARLIQRLDDDLKEMKSRLLLIEKVLLDLKSSFDRAEKRQMAAFVVAQFLTEEVAAIAKDEKNKQKMVENSRKRLHTRLEEANPANHR